MTIVSLSEANPINPMINAGDDETKERKTVRIRSYFHHLVVLELWHQYRLQPQPYFYDIYNQYTLIGSLILLGTNITEE